MLDHILGSVLRDKLKESVNLLKVARESYAAALVLDLVAPDRILEGENYLSFVQFL